MQNAIYSSLKAMHYHGSLDAMQAGDLPPPVHVRIKPTNVCNHACYFCAYRTDDVSLGEDMVVRDRIPKAKMAEIVDDLLAMGVKAVTFSGGGAADLSLFRRDRGPVGGGRYQDRLFDQRRPFEGQSGRCPGGTRYLAAGIH